MMLTLWIVSVLAPLLVAAVLAGTHRARTPRIRVMAQRHLSLAPLSLLPAALLTLLAPAEPLHASWLMMGITVGFDVVSRALTMVAVLLYAAAIWAVTWRYDHRAPELVSYLLVCFVGNAGVYLAQDVVMLYASFSLMSLAAVGLVVHERTAEAFRATRIYLVLAVISEMAVLAGVVFTAQAGGYLVVDAPAAVAESPHRAVIVALLLLGFGIKAGLVGLHMWLPLAHPAAPPPASAVLSGAMVKAGLVGFLRLLPLGEAAMPAVGAAVIVLALFGAFAAVVLGVVQRDPKVVLAYSTISQMGFLSVLVGTALVAPELAGACMTAAVIYAVHHGLAKGALFIGVPVWKHHATGLRRHLVIAGMAVAGLVVVGAPLSSGAVGKYAAKEAIESTEIWGVQVADLLPFVATGSTVLLVRLAWILLATERDPRHPKDDPALPAWLLLVALSASVPWILTDRWVPLDSVPGLEPVTLWDATWPMLIGLGIGALAWYVVPRWLPRLSAHAETIMKPGDLVIPIEAGTRRLAVGARFVSERIGTLRDRVSDVAISLGSGGTRTVLRVARAETAAAKWSNSGAALIAVLIVLTVLMLFTEGTSR